MQQDEPFQARMMGDEQKEWVPFLDFRVNMLFSLQLRLTDILIYQKAGSNYIYRSKWLMHQRSNSEDDQITYALGSTWSSSVALDPMKNVHTFSYPCMEEAIDHFPQCEAFLKLLGQRSQEKETRRKMKRKGGER